MVDYLAVDRADAEVAGADRRRAGAGRRAGRHRDRRRRARPARRASINGLDLAGACFGVRRRWTRSSPAPRSSRATRDRAALLGPALQRLHPGPRGARGRPARRRAPRPPARRGPARADRDLRASRSSSCCAPPSRSAASPTSPPAASTICCASKPSWATRSTTRCRSQPIFGLIQELGDVSDEEMHEVFNMGCGFCVVVAAADETAGNEAAAAVITRPARRSVAQAPGPLKSASHLTARRAGPVTAAPRACR